MLLLNKKDALWAANEIESFFDSFSRIDDYMRSVKLERMDSLPTALPGLGGPEENMFNDPSIHPEDMEFEIQTVDQKLFMTYMELVTSAPVEASIPGKGLMWFVREKNTNQIVGMIRFASPTINSKPRNDWLGSPLQTIGPQMNRFNDSAIMGFNIVPVQPFGFNALGGKLLAAICCSHHARRTLNRKFHREVGNTAQFCMFETTSLYGSTKGASMYDGMKPFLRHNGLTDSNFTPLINDKTFRDLHRWFTKKNDGVPLVPNNTSSRKLKLQMKFISVIKASLKEHDIDEYNKFCATVEHAKGLTERKRSYYCNYGYENVPEYLNLKTDTLIKKDNFDRFELPEVISWWRKKASKRYESLKKDGRLRSYLETWNVNPEEIDIIR